MQMKKPPDRYPFGMGFFHPQRDHGALQAFRGKEDYSSPSFGSALFYNSTLLEDCG
jgi:hypothetical protein